jgi:hypothetical protein
MLEFIKHLFCHKHMNATKIVATLEDGSEVVLFPVTVPETPTPESTPEIQKITVPLNTPIEVVAA